MIYQLLNLTKVVLLDGRYTILPMNLEDRAYSIIQHGEQHLSTNPTRSARHTPLFS